MPRAQKQILLTQNRQPQLQIRRPSLRYPVTITLQITIQTDNTLPELSLQPVEGNTDLLTEYRQVTRVMTSWSNDSHTHEHTHNIVPLLTLRPLE